MSDSKAFQIEVTSPSGSGRQVFFVEDAALAALARHPALLPDPVLKLQRRLSDSELDLHQIGTGDIVQWV
jgi:hypothetical protein